MDWTSPIDVGEYFQEDWQSSEMKGLNFFYPSPKPQGESVMDVVVRIQLSILVTSVPM